jgi:phenylacetate-coenzyme A ligase PaaK-like adenylate-forming protein
MRQDNGKMNRIKAGRRYAQNKGVNVFPSQIESVLIGLSRNGQHYEIHVQREGYMDSLEIYVEVIDESCLPITAGWRRSGKK